MPRDTPLPILLTLRQAIVIYILARKRLRPSLAFALAAKCSNGSNDRFLDRLIEVMGDVLVMNITQSLADQRAHQLYPHASAATRKRQFYNVLNGVLGFCARAGLCPTTRLISPDVPKNARTRCLHPDEVERMLAVAKPHVRLMLFIMLGTGATNSELFNLEWHHIDLDHREVAYPTRVAKLPMEIVAVLRRVPEKTGKVILRPDGKPYATKVNSGGQYKTTFGTLCRYAGLNDVRPGDLVTTFAMMHLAIHQSFAKLASDSGWPEHTVRRFKRVSGDKLARLRAALFASHPPIIPGGLPRNVIAPWGC